MQETFEFSSGAKLQSFFNLSQLFLANSSADVDYRTSPVHPKLVSLQLQGGGHLALMESQNSEKKFPSVIKS